MECVILFRTHGGTVDFIRTGDMGVDICVYPDREAAIEEARTRKLLQAVPYQIVELTEL